MIRFEFPISGRRRMKQSSRKPRNARINDASPQTDARTATNTAMQSSGKYAGSLHIWLIMRAARVSMTKTRLRASRCMSLRGVYLFRVAGREREGENVRRRARRRINAPDAPHLLRRRRYRVPLSAGKWNGIANRARARSKNRDENFAKQRPTSRWEVFGQSIPTEFCPSSLFNICRFPFRNVIKLQSVFMKKFR